ncbi:MAG: recombinase [Rhodoferax sp.]|nr:recombinase [Rhodoferax sp.]
MSHLTPAREYATGMGQAVADRTINRKIIRAVTPYTKQIVLPRQDDAALDDVVALWAEASDLRYSGYLVTSGDDQTVEIDLYVTHELQTERWEDVAKRVALGNSLLHPIAEGLEMLKGVARRTQEYDRMHHHLRQASLLMSGRHLQHGDVNQPSRPMEVFTNCATAAASFLSFYLLLNGSGVGRAYDDAMIIMDLRNLPITVCVCDSQHADIQAGLFQALDLRGAQHLYGHSGRKVVVFEVPDSREGWAKAIEKMEFMAFQGNQRETVLLLDFSKVRPKGAPINGMQGRPASGPGPLISAIMNVAKLRDAGMQPWRSALYADHYLAECVLVGGARRAARMSTKNWRDANVLEFVQVKRGGFLWSSNNSVTVDREFWALVRKAQKMVDDGVATSQDLMVGNLFHSELAAHAWAVFEAVTDAGYHDQTGEPGLITVDMLTHSDEGTETLFDGDFARSARYQLEDETLDLTRALAKAWQSCPFKVITNPCGEIVLIMLGGYCVIGDVVPFHAGSTLAEPSDCAALAARDKAWDNDAEDAFRVTTRALIRTNLMDSLYGKEVKRTNRIGVGMTGIHEYAFARFGYGWKDLVDEAKSLDFWLMLSRFKRAVKDEARRYATELGVTVPHTDTTIKPAGTTSKLFGLTEGAHLPSMREFLRWVQFRNGDPLIAEYRAKGYPVRELRVYSGTTIVGFPTAPTICQLGMGDKLVTAAEATPQEQYQYLRLLEKYWLTGVEEDGVTPLSESGNQVSYTLKYDPAVVSFAEFKRTLLEGQSTIRCCSVMPQSDTSAYEYLPEQPVSKHEYEQIAAAIAAVGAIKEDVGLEHVDCASGACPISFGENEASS